jgi:hypothetical protein
VKHIHLPPFFVGRGDGVRVARQVAAHQMQAIRASVFVCKDLAHHKDFIFIALKPAAHYGLLRNIQIFYAQKTLVFPVLIGHGDQSIILQRGDEMPALADDEFEVLGCRKPAIHQHKSILQLVTNTGAEKRIKKAEVPELVKIQVGK